MEKKEINRGLQISNDVREAILRTMKKKRVVAWLSYFVSMFLVVGSPVFWIQHWPGATPMYFSLPITIVLLIVAIFTLNATGEMEKALKMNNQSAFDEAMSKWNKRCMLTFGGYVLFALLVVGFLMRMIGIGQ